MSKPKFTPYLDSLTEAMKLCMEDDKTIFIGQQIVYYGNPMSKTIEGLPKERMIETPVMEETQMGMSMGLAMTGNQVVTFYPRWDFLIFEHNQHQVEKAQELANKWGCEKFVAKKTGCTLKYIPLLDDGKLD
mgnify:CR=1 FL=1